MFLLYLIGILCSLLMFAPSTIPGFVKFPVAFVVALLMVFFFNIYKNDSIYTVHEPKKKIVKCGLFSPLLMYVSASSYTLGFAMLFTYLAENNMVDVVANLSGVLGALSNTNVLFGLVLIVFGLLVYVLRNTFRAKAGTMSLQCRSAWYIVLTLISLVLGVISLFKFSGFDVYQYLSEGLNLFVYFGLAAVIILIDLIINLIVIRVNYCDEHRDQIQAKKESKKARKESKKAYKKSRKELKRKYKKAKKDSKLAKKAAKKARKEAKNASKKARKEAIKTAKREKKMYINSKKVAKKDDKKQRKLEKILRKKAKKAAKASE